jgi:hypothetical protein
MTKILERLQLMAKAIVAAVTPIVSVAVVDVLAELSVMSTGLIAAAATAALVYLTPNKTAQEG